jgi:glycopeptide antibiotics resistance protein
MIDTPETIPRIFYPFLPYRSLVFPILVLGAMVVPAWLVFRVYRLRSTGHRTSLQREILLLVFVAYLAGLAAVTLVPNGNSGAPAVGVDLHPSLASLTCSSAYLPAGSRAQSFCVRNARGNLLLFLPLGILLPLVWGRLRFGRGMKIAIALSSGIEVVQYLSRPWSNRNPDVNDLILNVLGACLGLLVVYLLRWRPGARPAEART